jgi:hypothetical protein
LRRIEKIELATQDEQSLIDEDGVGSKAILHLEDGHCEVAASSVVGTLTLLRRNLKFEPLRLRLLLSNLVEIEYFLLDDRFFEDICRSLDRYAIEQKLVLNCEILPKKGKNTIGSWIFTKRVMLRLSPSA